MKLGLSTFTYTWAMGWLDNTPASPMTLFDLLAQTKKMRLTVLQIADNIPPLQEGTDLDRLIQQAGEYGITLELGTSGAEPRHIRPYIHLAQIMDVHLLRTILDTHDSKPTVDQVIGWFREVLPELEKADLTLAIENHDRFKCDEYLQIVQEINHPLVGICLDTVNSFGALEGPEVVIEKFFPYTKNLHIKDFNIVPFESHMGMTIEGAPAGQGRLDIPALVKRFDESGNPCNGILELWPLQTGDVEEIIQIERQWAQESVDYLRPFFS